MQQRFAFDTTIGGTYAARMRISLAAIETIQSHAARAAPEECCGILFGTGDCITQVLPTANVAKDRRQHFEIAPQALVDAHRAARRGGPQVAGYYHSHPAGPASPSATDSAMAARDGSIWAIAGKGHIALWRDGDDGFEPLPYETLTA